PRAARPRRLAPEDLARLWGDLGDADAARAYQAVVALAAAPEQAPALLGPRVGELSAADRRVARLLADLGADRFAVRERATAELARLGEAAEPALRQLLREQPAPEVRRRAESLLQRVGDRDTPSPPAQLLRGLREVEVLEALGTPEARRVLERLA